MTLSVLVCDHTLHVCGQDRVNLGTVGAVVVTGGAFQNG